MRKREAIDRRIPAGDFRRIVLDEIRRLLTDARNAREIAAGNGFVKRDPTHLVRHLTIPEIVESIRVLAMNAARDFPEMAALAASSVALADDAVSAVGSVRLLEIYQELMDLHEVSDDESPDNFSLRDNGGDDVRISAFNPGDEADGSPAAVRRSDADDQAFLAAVANTVARSRRAGRVLSRDEQAAVAAAYRLLDRGVQIPTAYRSIGVSGFRRHQTSLSLANPGEGHISVTCAQAALMDGTIVHIEHIDRDGISDREKIEPYRLPAAINASRVRLHAGAAAPCTAYVGRPVFENGTSPRPGTTILQANDFSRDLLKTAHMTASACTAMFMNGVADCKIAIERMSFRQAIEFMKAVAGNVVRDPTRQYLSAAININLPIWDDRNSASEILVTDRLAVAELGIQLAVGGRFEKVTWDGASNQVPSVPITEQLDRTQWLDLIHSAHSLGLETYVSAGMVAKHMRDCVLCGVDGVGIGTSLHHRHPETNAIGQLKPEAIAEVLAIRDAAAREPLGQGAAMLARLDRMFFEGTLPSDLAPLRADLFQALKASNAAEALRLISNVDLPPLTRGAHPLIAQAERVLATAARDPVGKARLGHEVWTARLDLTAKFLKAGDLAGLEEILE